MELVARPLPGSALALPPADILSMLPFPIFALQCSPFPRPPPPAGVASPVSSVTDPLRRRTILTRCPVSSPVGPAVAVRQRPAPLRYTLPGVRHGAPRCTLCRMWCRRVAPGLPVPSLCLPAPLPAPALSFTGSGPSLSSNIAQAGAVCWSRAGQVPSLSVTIGVHSLHTGKPFRWWLCRL